VITARALNADLGGAVIVHNVEATLGRETPMRYLRMYGDRLGAMWHTLGGARRPPPPPWRRSRARAPT
jgi:hypothetical protein